MASHNTPAPTAGAPPHRSEGRGAAHEEGPDPGLPEPPGDGAAQTLGTYTLHECIGRGGMATVYAATDTRDGRRYAIKLLHDVRATASARSRFRREFRFLSRVIHPNVLRVLEWGMHGDRPWFSMEWVEGIDLHEAHRRWQGLHPADRFARVQGVLVQVGRALAALHDRGLVHRDVTPRNIRIATDGTAKLMDFGLVTNGEADLTQAGEILGTIAHCAPEQLLNKAVDGRTDLYALGTVLYVMLTGRRPFESHTVHGMMERQLHEQARPPSEIDPLVPEALDHICVRLLQKDPARRFASAAHLLHVLGDDAGAEQEDRFPPRTIGRSSSKGWIREHVDEVSSGRRGGAMLVSGAAGLGKSRLVDMAATEARRRGLRVHIARCRPHDRPFGLLHALYDSLETSGAPEVLRQALGPRSDHIVERYPVIAAFRDLVVANAPCVILIDRAEHIDAASREALSYLVRNILVSTRVPVMLLIAAEADQDDEVRVLDDCPTVHREHLRPLDQTEVEELVLSMMSSGPASLALAHRLHEETQGHPAFLADMLRGLMDEGVLRRDQGRWQLTLSVDDIRGSRLPMPPTLRATLSERIAPLSENALQVGRVIALARHSLDHHVLMRASPLSEDQVMDALDDLVDAGIVIEHHEGQKDRVELSHRRFRDVLTDGLALAERQARHRQLGELMEQQHRHSLGPVYEDLAWHFEQADVPTKAFGFLYQTARRHLAGSFYDNAWSFLDRALGAEPAARVYMPLDQADEQLASLRLDRARCMFHFGQRAEALAELRQADALATAVRNPALQSKVNAELGQQLRKQGHFNDAERPLLAAIDHARAAGDRRLLPGPLYQLGAIAWARGDLQLATERWHETRAVAEDVQDARAQAQIDTGLGILALCRGKIIEARQHFESSAERFDRLGMVQQLTITRLNLVELHHATGVLRRASRLLDEALAQAREVNFPHGLALSHTWRARLLGTLGRTDDARHAAAEAERLARKHGTADDLALALATHVDVLLDAGLAEDALPRAQEASTFLSDTDTESLGPRIQALLTRSLVSLGDMDAARRAIRPLSDVAAHPHVRVQVDIDVGQALLRTGDHEEAHERLLRATTTAAGLGLRLMELHAHALLAELPKLADGPDHRRKASSIARNLAANLDVADSAPFLRRFTPKS